MSRVQLTHNFWLHEFEVTSTGLNNKVPASLVPNVRRLAECLQKIRDKINNPITVTSGYRSPEVNSHPRVKGSLTSAHCQGLAADIICKEISAKDLALIISEFVKELGIDQVIYETDSRGNQWVHVGLRPIHVTPRNQSMTATYSKQVKKMIYTVGIQ